MTLELTEQEARDFCLEVLEVEGYLSASLDQGNTRTGLAQIRRIRDYLTDRGLGVRAQTGFWATPPEEKGLVT
jgi:hypothetical protein